MRVVLDLRLTGTLTDGARDRHVAVRASARAPTLLALLGWGPLALEGTVTLGDQAFEAVLLPGSHLEIGTPLHGRVQCQIVFRGPRKGLCRLFGEARATLLVPRDSSLRVDCTLFEDGLEAGRGELRLVLAGQRALLRSLFEWAA